MEDRLLLFSNTPAELATSSRRIFCQEISLIRKLCYEVTRWTSPPDGKRHDCPLQLLQCHYSRSAYHRKVRYPES